MRAGRADDLARELAPVLADETLYRFIGGGPLSVADLGARYRRLATGCSPDGSQAWLNWVVRRREDAASDGRAVGTIQATVTPGDPRPDTVVEASLAWVISAAHHRRGYASEAALGVAVLLGEQGVGLLSAMIHPDHTASQAVARAIGLRPTAVVVEGEVRWQAAPPEHAERRHVVSGN